jgi:hypothetical protein
VKAMRGARAEPMPVVRAEAGRGVRAKVTRGAWPEPTPVVRAEAGRGVHPASGGVAARETPAPFQRADRRAGAC